MPSLIAVIAIDAVNPRLVAEFWCNVLGWHVVDEDHEGVISSPRPAARGGRSRGASAEGFTVGLISRHQGHLDALAGELANDGIQARGFTANVRDPSSIAKGAGAGVSLNDLADSPPVPLKDGQVIELGRHRVRHIDTPHVSHAWEARVLYEETTKTFPCSDLFTQLGQGPALTNNDIVDRAR